MRKALVSLYYIEMLKLNMQGVFVTKKFAKQTLAQFTKSDNYVHIGERRA